MPDAGLGAGTGARIVAGKEKTDRTEDRETVHQQASRPMWTITKRSMVSRQEEEIQE